MKEIFGYQTWHYLALLFLLISLEILSTSNETIMSGFLWGLSTKTWFWIAVAVPILHQIYVWLVWRLELYTAVFTKNYGLEKAFKIYKIGFSLLFVSRLLFIIFLAFSNRNSLEVNPSLAYVVAAVITVVVLYLFYSVIKYFTIDRAYGIDHFDKNYNEPYVKKGIFRFTDNGMYIYGLMILYLPGILLFSKAALLVALFNHIYIWVHYYTTERPDMKKIYGTIPD